MMAADLRTIISRGAVILDVRTEGEYVQGHVEGSLNIPLDQLPEELANLPKDRPVIACCRSGSRSGVAAGFLNEQGFEAYNGGPWTTVRALLQR